MRYRHVCIEAFACTLPPHVVTSDEIERRLEPVYDRLALPAGRLELMTGIRERRFFDPGVKPGEISARTAAKALEAAGLERGRIGAVIHGSVCRDQLEPATANFVHHACRLPADALVFDVSNACLGLLNGMSIVADLIEAGRIAAGLVVGTEIGRPLVEGTIDALLDAPHLTRADVKREFASLTIGSGSAAIVLSHSNASRTGNRLLGGTVRTDTHNRKLCTGGESQARGDSGRPRMQTDAEALLHAGVDLAERTFVAFKRELEWSTGDIDKVFTHQVGRAHRKLLLERLGLDLAIDFPTVETLGNTGAAALPMAAALGVECNHLQPGDCAALLGIGSGLNSVMLGVEWAT